MVTGNLRGTSRAQAWGLPAWAGRLAILGALGTITLGAAGAHAATFNVANKNDSGDGSLRAAITQANAAAGADTITFAAGVGTPILLKSALPTLSGALSINGPGVTKLTVARDSTTQFRIFTTAEGSTVTIAGLNIVGGDVSALEGDDAEGVGGNILNNGTLTIRECIVFRGKASSGGGVLNNFGGTLNIISTTVSGNTSTADGTGGGVANAGTLNISNSAIRDNEAEDDGGGIFHFTGTMTIENSTISGNECVSGGGGIITGGSDEADPNLITRISNSVISNNKSFNSAGGIDSSDGSMTITNSTFTGNTAGSTDGTNRGAGGAIENRRATLTISGSTFSGNSADNGGAISNSVGALSITNSTLSGNSANAGGAISAGDGSVTIASSTLTLNQSGVGAGINGSGTKISNSIIAGNTGQGVDVRGTVSSGGYNIVGTVSDGATFTATGDRIGITDPKLGPLAHNGGPTFTHLPQAGSPAIDAGDTPLAVDQRGQARPKGTRDDIGSVESAAAASGSVLSIANAGSVKEGNIVSGVAKFVVTLTPAATQEVRVGYRAQNGTAIEDSDFAKIPANAQIVFAPGETSKTIEVRIVADDLVEANETFAIQLITPQNATINPQAATGTATIVDDDTAALTLSIIPGTFSEAAGATAARGVVSRNTATTAALTVNLSSSNPAKATVPATVVIPAGQTSANFNVSAVDNAIVDGSKKVTISAKATGLETANLDVTVTDNDSVTPTLPSLSIAPSPPFDEGNSGQTNVARYAVVLSAPSSQEVRVGYGTEDGTATADVDYRKPAANATLVFAPGQTRRAIEIPIIGDLLVEDDETFVVRLTNPQNATLNPGADNIIQTIVDDDRAPQPNTPPVAMGIQANVPANQPTRITLMGGDKETLAVNLTFRVVTQPKNGTLSGTTPNLIYTPNDGFTGSDSFTFVANDGQADSAPGTITLQVLAAPPANTPPVAVAQNLSTTPNTPLRITLRGTDSDVPAQTLTFSIVTQPKNGTLSGPLTNLVYTPRNGFTGVDSFTFVANDGVSDSFPSRIGIRVASGPTPPPTDAPVANPDSYNIAVGADTQSAGITIVTTENFPNGFFRIAAPGVLANDLNAAGGTLSARIVTYPTKGRLRLNADGSFDYLPNNGFSSADTFTYVASNGRFSAPATVTLNVTDKRGPELRFDTPRDGATVSAVTEIKGRVRDRNAALKSPTLLWQRFDGKYWNGNMWISEATELVLSVDDEIGFFYVGALPPPGTNADTDLLDGEYKLRVTASDVNGNTTRITNTITVRNGATTAP